MPRGQVGRRRIVLRSSTTEGPISMAQDSGARSASVRDAGIAGTDRSGRGTGALDARDDGRHTGLTPAQWYCLLGGAALLLAGIFGFISDATFDAGSNINGDSFLGFEVNGWHNLVHIASGGLLLAAFRRRAAARTVAIAFGVVYGAVAVYGLVDGNDVLGLIPVNPADNVLHIALSLVGILAGIASPTDEHRRDRSAVGRDTDTDAERAGRIGRDYDPLTGRPRDDAQITNR
jgi:hypothetical protein